MQLLSRKHREFTLQSYLWRLKGESEFLPFALRFRKTQCLVERRSKGKLFKAIDRVSQEHCTVRRIYLDITNAGQDDGLPTSVLRELSHLRTLDHPNIARVIDAEVQERIVHLSFEYCEMNLKEYIKKYCEPT